MPSFDTLVLNGTVVDGLRTPRYVADIGIRDGKVAAIGRFDASDAARVIDARGLIVAPGFVDLHTHYDSQVYWDPYCTISGWHGVTSVAIGNCGFGFAPVKPEDRDRAMRTMERNEAVRFETMKAGMPWDWVTFPEFLASLQRTPKGVNMLSFVGLNPLMSYVMGLEAAKSRPATPAERDEMCRLLGEAMEAGACGFSAQILGENSLQRDFDGTPMITDTMSEDDLLAFARVLRDKGRGFIQVLGASPALSDKLAAESGRPVVWNAIAVDFDNHGLVNNVKRTLDWLVRANAEGRRIIGQALTCANDWHFTFEDWNLYDSSPNWREVTLGTPEQKLAKLQDPAWRERLRDEYGQFDTARATTMTSIHNLILLSAESERFAKYDGQQVADIAAAEGLHAVDALLDVVVASELRASFMTPPQRIDMQAMGEIANHPYTLPGVSDGGAHMKFITLGRYPTEFLAVLVREHGIMDLEQAHWRLSAYPAMASGFVDRGFIREGAPADLVIYDYEHLKLGPVEVLHDFPAGDWRRACKPEGYRWILVNGEPTFIDGVCTGATPGKLLRHGTG
jgi:N-acyl-D-aspartate/D-glutamate deacylase